MIVSDMDGFIGRVTNLPPRLWQSSAPSPKARSSIALRRRGAAPCASPSPPTTPLHELKAVLADWLREKGTRSKTSAPMAPKASTIPITATSSAKRSPTAAGTRRCALRGSGIGISISVNRNPAARCALVSEPLSAKLSREHNDANVIAMGARLTGIDMAKACLDAFLDHRFRRRPPRAPRRQAFQSAPTGDQPMTTRYARQAYQIGRLLHRRRRQGRSRWSPQR